MGSLGAVLCLGVAWATGSLFWYALASSGVLVNLFNLIPVSPMDGGRVVGVINRWLWVAGYMVGIIVFLATQSPVLFLILLVGLFNLPQVVHGPREGYFEVASHKRIVVAAAYFGVMAILATGMSAADQRLEGRRSHLRPAAAARPATS